ncbi:hypothetical protein K2X89_16895 [Myxococcota bacterium]|nr:hypothetical protein [Myxococcota bacterium]
MRNRRCASGIGLLAGVLVGLLTGVASAGEFRSGFGFGISVPDIWLVLTRGEVERNSALFLEEDGGGVGGLDRIPLSMRRTVFDRVLAGELEIFYRRESDSDVFVDNVNFLLQPAELPSTREQLAGVCRLLPGEFSRIFGRPIAMEACEMRDRARRPALYLQFEGAIPGTTTMQYQLPRDHDETLVITATTARASLPRMQDELEGMVESIRID